MMPSRMLVGGQEQQRGSEPTIVYVIDIDISGRERGSSDRRSAHEVEGSDGKAAREMHR